MDVFLRLEGQCGSDIFLRPDRIVAVESPKDGTESSIWTDDREPFHVKGGAMEIMKKIQDAIAIAKRAAGPNPLSPA